MARRNRNNDEFADYAVEGILAAKDRGDTREAARLTMHAVYESDNDNAWQGFEDLTRAMKRHKR